MKRVLFGFIFLLFCAIFSRNVRADASVNAYFFWGEGCPHCAQELVFLEELQKDYPDLRIHSYEIYKDSGNVLLLQKVGRALGVEVQAVPFLVVGDIPFSGFKVGTISESIERRVSKCSVGECPDSVADIVGVSVEDVPEEPVISADLSEDQEESADPVFPEDRVSVDHENPSLKEEAPEDDSGMVDVPVLGSIDIEKMSLPALAVVLGVLDGFNPCAMWVLLFLISMLLGMKNRGRMWVLGFAFIASSAAVYFIFMAAWLNLILFLGFLMWIRLLIGGVALAGGLYSVRDFFVNKEGGCKVTNDKKRQRIFSRIKDIIGQKNFLAAVIGIVVLAFMVNLVELVCSAGLPAIFTQVLTLNDLPVWQYYGYILVYIFFFMVDDLFVFVVSMKTLELTGLTTRYTRYSRLVGGVLMLLVGILLVLKPEYLMFS
jgi:cytochrome c biogenesis protein CcdA/glutaredoxin